jgi:hypothetical protein
MMTELVRATATIADQGSRTLSADASLLSTRQTETTQLKRREKVHLGEFMTELRVYLKICEGCGCLWFRPSNQGTVYCIDCRGKLESFPTPESRKKPGRPRTKKLGHIWAVATAEGGEL